MTHENILKDIQEKPSDGSILDELEKDYARTLKEKQQETIHF